MAGLLDGKVVVISGVGPALGTTLARRCAENGADLVLAARTVQRLDDVAKQVTDLGRRAVAVGTDITDDTQVENLVKVAVDTYGNRVTGFQDAVTLSSSDHNATLPATYTFQPTDYPDHYAVPMPVRLMSTEQMALLADQLREARAR